MELAILLAVAAAVVWVLTTRGNSLSRSVGIPIFWILLLGAIVALLFEAIGGGPPDDVPPG